MKRGFTLIELLVVIAIIGILSSIVLASLNSARNKGRDASIKSQMQNMRSQASLFLLTHGSYLGTGAANSEDSLEECNGTHMSGDFVGTVFDVAVGDGMGTMLNGVYAVSSGAGARVFCAVRADSWAFAAPLYVPAAGTRGWCVDSSGAAKTSNINFNEGGNTTALLSGDVARCP